MKLVAIKVVELMLSLLQLPMHLIFRSIAIGKLKLKMKRCNLLYKATAEDIFIVSYPKSGTTWMQMLLYQLSTDGEMRMSHIDEVSPHLEETLILSGRTINDLPHPRIIKSHLPYRMIPKGVGRYIYVMRDGLDVAVSYYHQSQTGNFESFFDDFLNGKVPYGSWFEHVSTWVKNKDALNLMIVRYEDLIDNLEGTAQKISQFCRIKVEEAEWPRILHNSSFAFMREHEAKFNLMNRHMGRESSSPPVMLRNGRVGDRSNYVTGAMFVRYRSIFEHWFKHPLVEHCYRPEQK